MSNYYYTDGRERFGPYALDELRDKGLTRDTLVWKQGLPDWVPAGQVSELIPILPASDEPPAPRFQPFPSGSATPPKNWLLESILVTLFCCLPFGILAIIYSTKVDTLWASGQYEAAERASRDAGRWVKITAVLGVFSFLAYLAYIFLVVIANVLPAE